MPSAIRRLIASAALSNLVAVPAQAQRSGPPAGEDYTIHNFRFASGEMLPDLRIHYITLGKPRREPAASCPDPPPLGLSIRALIIGVSVKLTSSDTITATAAVIPN